MKGPFVEIVWFDEEWAEDQARRDGERAGRNRRAWEAGIIPRGPNEIRVGDLAMPLLAYWYRGAGVVDEVDEGGAWVVFGPRERSDDTSTVRCRLPWNELVVVGQAESGGPND